MKYCILNSSKICDDCGECNRCDLDPNKICDNCCKCIERGNQDEIEMPLTSLYEAMERNLNIEEGMKPFSDEELAYENDVYDEESRCEESDFTEEVSEDDFGGSFGDKSGDGFEDELHGEIRDSSEVEPLDIDPELMAEWERKLQEYEESLSHQEIPGKNLHGSRKRRQ